MKIGLVCPYDIFRGGGVQEHVLEQAAELRRRGYEVKILTPKPHKNGTRHQNDILFIGSSAKLNTPIKTSLELGISLTRDAVDDLLAREQFDLLHIHEPEVPVLGAQIVAKASCPIIATFHAIHPETPMARTIEVFRIPYSHSIFSRISAMTAVSDTAAMFVRERTKQPVTIIPNGINLKKYQVVRQQSSALQTTQTILYVGRLEARKGVRHLIMAIALLKTPNVNLVIAGEGPDLKKLQMLAQELKLKNVNFLGFIDESQKISLLHDADLFCTPALYGESFGIVLLEAMAAGLVTVAGNNPGYVSLLQGRGALSIIDPLDTHDFARRIDLLLNDKEIRGLWRDWAKVYVKQYDYKKVVDSYEKLYKQVIRN